MIFILLVFLCLIGCDIFDNPYQDDKPEPDPFNFTGTYNLILVPVPIGGIDFPIGVEDDDIARVESAYYIGETLITNALLDTVGRWAMEEKEVGKYYGFIHDHHKRYEADAPVDQYFASGYNSTYDYSAMIGGIFSIPIWCNAFTEWYNEKHGTNLVPVYQDSYGNPIRYINNSYDFIGTANPSATGFRLPTTEEWELAARWNENSTVNAVTKRIKSIDFSSQEIRFTRGNSASGARDSVSNFNENDRVAVWENNSSDVTPVKTKEPNMLGLYDMSGNTWELTSTWAIFWGWGIPEHKRYQYRGGHATSSQNDIAIGYKAWVSAWTSGVGSFGYSRGFRVVRNAE
jgi:formylglycine-generating enzyme required for sulfatase activity